MSQFEERHRPPAMCFPHYAELRSCGSQLAQPSSHHSPKELHWSNEIERHESGVAPSDPSRKLGIGVTSKICLGDRAIFIGRLCKRPHLFLGSGG